MKQTVQSAKSVTKKTPIGRTVTKRDIVHAICREKQTPENQVRRIVQQFLDEIIATLASGNRLEFREFGVFEVVCRKQRTGRNPKMAAISIIIPPKNVVKFTPGKRMRKLIERELPL